MTSNSTEDLQAAQRQRNPLTLERLASKGVARSSRRSVLNVFFAFSEAGVLGLQFSLEGAGYSIEEAPRELSHGGQSYWALDAGVVVAMDLDALNEMTDRCVELADENAAEYDGWFTEVAVPSN